VGVCETACRTLSPRLREERVKWGAVSLASDSAEANVVAYGDAMVMTWGSGEMYDGDTFFRKNEERGPRNHSLTSVGRTCPSEPPPRWSGVPNTSDTARRDGLVLPWKTFDVMEAVRLSRTISVFRMGPSGTCAATAANGTDYPALPGSATIPAGARSVRIRVIPIDDTAVEPPETVILTLQSDPGYAIGGVGSAAVTILDNDVGLPFP